MSGLSGSWDDYDEIESLMSSSSVHTPVDNALGRDVSRRNRDIHDDEWMEHARCKGVTHLMFPREHKDITYIAMARVICGECSVSIECLDYALTFPAGDMHGVWAGYTPRQLAREQAERGIRPSVPTLAQMWSDLH